MKRLHRFALAISIARLLLVVAALGGGRTAAATPVETIAYQSCWVDYPDDYDSGSWCDIWVKAADGSGHLLMENGVEPAWSPDGSKIAFSRFNPAGGIVVLDVVDGTLTEVASSEGGRGAAWSPDGAKILFRSGNDLLVANANGTGGVVQVTTRGDVEGRPAWSPDGSRIAYGCLGASGSRDICSMNADGTGLVQLTDNTGYYADPAYSPDGSRIAFTTGEMPYGWTSVMTSEGAALRETNGGYWPAWSPDGTRIATGNAFAGACQGDGFLCYDTLSVIDPDGAGDPEGLGTGSYPSWTASAQLVRPVASRWDYCGGAYCRFVSTSWDMNGTIVGEEWDFGDGTTGSGATTEHVYSVSGTYDVTLTVTDNDGLTATLVRPVSVVVYVPPVPPVASFTFACTDNLCAFDGTASSDPNGTIVSYAWVFGDDSTGSGAAATHTYAAAGTYTVWLAVVDNDGLEGSTVRSVTVTNPRSHVGDLDGAVTGAGGSWTARVTAVVHERGEARLANATLTGNWSIGGSSSCTTNAAGECAVSKPSIPNSTRNVTFTVTGVTHATRLYVAGENHDPDGDSTGTAITVNR